MIIDGDIIYSTDQSTRVRVNYDGVHELNSVVGDWEHGYTIRPVTVSRTLGDELFTVGHDEISDLFDEVAYRFEECNPAYSATTVEERREMLDESKADAVGGGIKTEDDMVEVFARLARLKGIAVLRRNLLGSVQSDWADVLIWSTEDVENDPANLNAFAQTAEDYLSGNVYMLTVEKAREWEALDGSGDTLTTWEHEMTVGEIIGNDSIKHEVEEFLN